VPGVAAYPSEFSYDLATVDGAPRLHLAEGSLPLDADQRARLVAGMRGGQVPPKLHMQVVAFRQPTKPNRNFVRFVGGTDRLARMAQSFAGVPFLRDHAQRNTLARGGSVLQSTLREAPDGPEFVQAIELAAPWAIEAALLGLIDRFSIGWHTTGDTLCSVCQAPLWEGECFHYPGDVVDGARVEAQITAADGVETSTVIVPAVIGTGVEAVRAAYLARLERRPASIYVHGLRRGAVAAIDRALSNQGKPKELKTMDRLTSSLGLAEDAPDEDIAAAVVKLKDDRDRAAAQLEVERQAHGKAKARADELAAELAKRQKAEDAVAVDALLDRLRSKVGHKLGEDKKPIRGGTDAEKYLLSVAERSIEEAGRFVDSLPQVIPTRLQSRETQETRDLTARQRSTRRMDDSLGLTAEDFAKYAPRKDG